MSSYKFPFGDKKLNLAMLGMVDGNGHPYSWSAIFNGYDRDEMSRCPYPAIPEYLGKEPSDSLRIPDALVTHIWTDDPSDAPKVAKASKIPNVVKAPEDVIGNVDAVIIATDKGCEHVKRVRPFVEAGIPVFIDKPLVDNINDLKQFMTWVNDGALIMSSSCMRYAKEFLPYKISTNDLGSMRMVTITTPKSWERYGIHALESIYPIIGPGFLSVRNSGTYERNIVHIKHKKNIDIIVAAINDIYGSFGLMNLYGNAKDVSVRFSDTFYAFKAQLVDFVNYLRTGERSFPFDETVELMKLVICGIISREENSREVFLSELK